MDCRDQVSDRWTWGLMMCCWGKRACSGGMRSTENAGMSEWQAEGDKKTTDMAAKTEGKPRGHGANTSRRKCSLLYRTGHQINRYLSNLKRSGSSHALLSCKINVHYIAKSMWTPRWLLSTGVWVNDWDHRHWTVEQWITLHYLSVWWVSEHQENTRRMQRSYS